MIPTNENMPTPLAARAYCEVMAQLRLRGEASACAIFEATRATLGLPEEQCGGEILDAMCVGVRQGMIGCNTCDLANGSVTIGGHTVLTAAVPIMLH